tara:strand:+ start:34 stop:558 length:525 start_codon:yes stop_codon:yes gene_type:complete
MKKTLYQIFIGILILSCSSTKNANDSVTKEKIKEEIITYDFAGRVDNNELIFIKENYNWNTSRILIINFKQPLSDCHFNNHKISNKNRWWNEFYSKIDTENCMNIHVMANGEQNFKKIDNKKIFDDKNDFLQSKFFGRRTSCFGVLVINSEGDYIQYNGHYSEKQVSKYIDNLR